MTRPSASILAPSRLSAAALLVMLLGLGIGIRLYDLTDLPLDFHPTRQLLSELKARGMYFQRHPELPDWQRRMAIQQWKTKAEVEPEVFERLVAFTYEATGVQPSVARVYSSLFWVVGAFFLFMLAASCSPRMPRSSLTVAYFLFFPYAVTASRSFQPDVLMVVLILCFWWLFIRWSRTESWLWALAAGRGRWPGDIHQVRGRFLYHWSRSWAGTWAIRDPSFPKTAGLAHGLIGNAPRGGLLVLRRR